MTDYLSALLWATRAFVSAWWWILIICLSGVGGLTFGLFLGECYRLFRDTIHLD
jgi:hypothetical protein